jgi:hypothetical protein
LTKIGILEFQFAGDPVLLEVHVFDVTHYEGEPVETEGKIYCTPTSVLRLDIIVFSVPIG